MFEIEDAIPPDEKLQARNNIIEALNEIDWGKKSISMRINGLDTPYMYRDLVDILEAPTERLDLILIPKAGTAADIYAVDMLVTQIEQATGREKPVAFQIMIETAQGMANIDEIAAASPMATQPANNCSSRWGFNAISAGAHRSRARRIRAA